MEWAVTGAEQAGQEGEWRVDRCCWARGVCPESDKTEVGPCTEFSTS